MSRTLAITNTAGTDNIIIAPGQLNGFAGSNNDTDLRLYGVGTQQWGEGVNENLYRILENFACPPKELNDHNPVSSNNDYDPSTQDILPKDANDLGPGRGINNPTTGQIWFNTETSSLYVFDQDVGSTFGWRRLTGSVPASATSPVTPNLGDLWYDTNAAQLKTWNGSNWISVADQYLPLDGTSAMSGTLDLDSNKIVNLTDPNNAQDAATKNYVDTQIGIIAGGGAGAYVQITGSTMTGILNLDTTSGSRLNVSYNSSTLTIGNGGNITTGSDIRKTGNMLVTADGGMYMHFATGSTFRVARGGANRNSGFNDLLTVTNSGVVNVIPGYETLGLSNTSLINKAYFDVNKTSQLNQLNDVQTSPSDGDVLRYNGGANRWEQGAGANFGFPAGVIVPYGGGTEPTGWLQCDGSPVSRTTYSDLFNNIGTNYGAGDGSTTFNLPDFRGEFLRGWDDGRGVDTGRTLGSNQSDQANSIRSHDSTSNTSAGSFADREVPDDGSYSEFSWTGRSDPVTKAIRMRKWGRETRPRNVTVNYIIKT